MAAVVGCKSLNESLLLSSDSASKLSGEEDSASKLSGEEAHSNFSTSYALVIASSSVMSTPVIRNEIYRSVMSSYVFRNNIIRSVMSRPVFRNGIMKSLCQGLYSESVMPRPVFRVCYAKACI